MEPRDAASSSEDEQEWLPEQVPGETESEPLDLRGADFHSVIGRRIRVLYEADADGAAGANTAEDAEARASMAEDGEADAEGSRTEGAPAPAAESPLSGAPTDAEGAAEDAASKSRSLEPEIGVVVYAERSRLYVVFDHEEEHDGVWVDSQDEWEWASVVEVSRGSVGLPAAHASLTLLADLAYRPVHRSGRPAAAAEAGAGDVATWTRDRWDR